MATTDERRFAANQQFLRVLGREARPDELDGLMQFMADDRVSPDEIGQILQGTPEYQRAQLEKDTTAFGGRLNAQNADILNQAGAAAQSRFAGLGRPNTSALGASVMQAGGQLAQSRQSALANFYGQGLQRASDLQAQQGTAARNRGYGIVDEKRQRGYQIEDYYRQKNDYADAERAKSGWNAITPEFAVGSAIGIGGQLGAAYLGGYGGARGAAGKGLFGG